MGIVKKAKELSQSNTKASDLTWDGSRGWNVIRGTEADDLPDNFKDYIIEGLRRNPVVAACVREIQTSLSEAPIHVFQQNDMGQDVRIPDHPLEELFQRPNRRDSYVTFIESSLQHFILGGNVFWMKRREGGIPVELLPIRPDRVVGADTNADGFPMQFEIREGDDQLNKTRKVPFDDIVHIPDSDPLNEVFGMPRIMAAVLDIATDNEASNYVNEVLGNYGSPGTVVTMDSERVKKEMLERGEAMWQEKFGPGRGRGKVAFIPGGQQVMQIGFNLRDLEFEALRQVTRESIAAALGVDPMVVNITTAGRSGTLSGNEYKEARRKLWTQTLIPMMRRWEAAINAFLTPEFGDVIARFDLKEVLALQKDRADQIDRARKMVQAGATLQEARAEMDLDPEPEDDDMFVVTGRTDIIPVSFFTEGGMNRDEAVEEIEGGESDDGGEEEDPDKNRPSPLSILRHDLMRWMKNNPVKSKGPLSPGLSVSPEGSLIRAGNEEDAERAYKQFEGFANSQEAGYRLAAEDIFEKQRRDIIRVAQRTLRHGEESSSDGPSDEKQTDPRSVGEFEVELGRLFDRYNREWERRYRPLYEQSADAVAARLSGAVGVALSTFDDRIRSFIEDRVAEIVDADERTKEAILEVVRQSLTADLGNREMVDEIRKVFDEGFTYTRNGKEVTLLDAEQRAELIARTETTIITNGSGLELMRQETTIPWAKQWLSMRDNRVRPAHQQEDEDSRADPVPLNESFRITGKDFPWGYNCVLGWGNKRVLTGEGWKAIKDIEVGDEVYTHKGRLRKVTALNHGRHEGSRVKISLFESGASPITLTPEHPLLTSEGWKEAQNITKDDKLIIAAHPCQNCGDLAPHWRETCSESCSTELQWKDEETRELMQRSISQASAQMWAEKGGDPEWRKKVLGPAHEKNRELVENGEHSFQKWWQEVRAEMTDEELKEYLGNLRNYKSGSDHPLWRGGRTAYARRRGEAPGDEPENRKLALERDDHSCQNCGITKEHTILDVHHIQALSKGGTNYLDNLITLCKPCHADLEDKKKKCKELLKGQVSAGFPEEYEHPELQFMEREVGMIEMWESPYSVQRWNFSVEEDESFIVESFVSHNCRCVITFIQPEDEVAQA